jgi:hypothetical protein
MGLANAPSQFQRLMDLVMAGLLWDCCLVYLDDVIVFSRTFDEHLKRLAAVFDRLSKFSLKIKMSKCGLLRETFSGTLYSVQASLLIRRRSKLWPAGLVLEAFMNSEASLVWRPITADLFPVSPASHVRCIFSQ